MQTPQNGPYRPRKPSNPPVNLPPAVLIALCVLFAIFLFQEYVLGLRSSAVIWQNFGFIPARYTHALGDQGLAWLWSPFTYSLLHGGWTHIVFNSLWLAIFGAPVARRIGTLRFVIFWLVSAAASAFFFAFTDWGAPSVLIGASGVVSAYMGAACRFVFSAGGGFSPYAHRNPRMSISAVFADRTASAFVLFWLVGNFLIALGVGFAGIDASAVAWQAHIGGFLFGFLAFPLFDTQKARTLRF
ncbi:rhomboid family intramembrane serine protease [Martelella mediterranea]|uniref:Membrane associated rhomboid family serine protease n=1 Tax=Martelella mediterranea TaxID=293089 RepID=A0A4R3NTS3_9HYPH|nr:rhomboid family intramembrane serine protease [Martelella mediterranea]TCT38821.1 membrane associated rhomboid family serine protease [Martelella mediterranea]